MSLFHNFTFISAQWCPAIITILDSHDIVFSHEPLGDVASKKSAPKNVLKEYKGTKKQRARRWWQQSWTRRRARSRAHSNSEPMLMSSLWSLRRFPCFQHLQGPHGACGIKTTKWEIWAFSCEAGGGGSFQPACPFSVPPQDEKIRKKMLWNEQTFQEKQGTSVNL